MTSHYMLSCPTRVAAHWISHYQQHPQLRPAHVRAAEAAALAAAAARLAVAAARAMRSGGEAGGFSTTDGEVEPVAARWSSAASHQTFLFFFGHQPVDAYIGKGSFGVPPTQVFGACHGCEVSFVWPNWERLHTTG